MAKIGKRALLFGVLSSILLPLGFAWALANPPTILTPGLFTSQNTTPTVNGNTGALTEQIPLDIPPGRNALQPDLSLQYNSQDTDQDSLVGYGWSLTIPYVERLNKTGSQNLYVSYPYFTSSIDGELASTSAGVSSENYVARVDEGNFDQYSYSTSTNEWIMYDKKGDQYLFGASNQSQQYATTSTSTVYKWMLEKEIDPNGNYVRYVYHKDSNQIYPYQIIYTGNNSTDGPMTITFATTTRTDDTSNLLAGFEVDTDYLISQITIAISSTTVRQYALSYTTGNNGSRSLLSSAQESGWNSSGVETTLPPWTFAYVSSIASFVSSYGGTECSGDSYAATDATGHGVNDSVVAYENYDTGSNWVTIAPDNNVGSATTVSSPGSGVNWGYGLSAEGACPNETGTRFVDVNGDGKADLVQNAFDYSTGASTALGLYYETSTSSYAWTSTSAYNGVIPQFYVHGVGEAAGTTGIFGDVNGTGLPTYEQNISSGGMTGVNNGAYIANGSAWNVATTSVFDPPASFPNESSDCTDSQLIDVNGDGLADWVWTDGVNTYADLNNGSGWNSASSLWTIPTSTVYESGGNCYDRGMRFVDINGDGLPDFVRSFTNSDSGYIPEVGTSQFVYLNTGHGWATSTAYTLPYIVSGRTNYGLANFTGNGQQDQDVLATSTNPKGGSTSITYGYTSQSGTNPNLPYDLLVVTSIVNHDGRGSNEETDYGFSGGKQYLPSDDMFDRKFAGFYTTTATSSNAVTTTYYDQGDSVNTSAGEQSDGYEQIGDPFRVDVMDTSDNMIQRTLYRWDADVATSTPNDFPYTNVAAYWKFDESSGTAADATENGNTLTNNNTVTFTTGKINNGASFIRADNQYFSKSDDASLSVTGSLTLAAWVKFNSLPITGQLFRFLSKTDGTASGESYFLTAINVGGTLQLYGQVRQNSTSYSPILNNWSFTTGVWYHVALVFNAAAQTLTLYVNGNQLGSQVTSTVSAIQDTTAPLYVGAGAVSGEQMDGMIDEAGLWNNALTADQIAQLYNSGAGLAYSTVSSNPAIDYGFLHLGSKIVESFKSDGTHTDSATTYTYATSTQNLIQQNDYGHVVASSTGTFVDSGNDDRTTLYSYAASTSINLFVPTEKTLLNASSSTSTDSLFYYDSLPFGSVDVGNLTEEQDWVSGSHYASTTRTYNAYGLVATSTDPDGNKTSYIYDAFNLYPATTTNALSQQTGYTYNYSNGKVEKTFDPNGRLTVNSYDGVGRLTQVSESDVSSPSMLDTKTVYAYTDSTTTPSLLHESDYLTSTSTADSYDYYDGLGRLIQERRSTENSATSSVIDHIYNAVGIEASTSLPYFSLGTSFTSPTSNTALYTVQTFDPLQRVTKITTNVGSSAISYGGWVATTTDPDGNVTAQISDAYGTHVQVNEVDGTSTFQTLYTYDAANNLTSITDADGNVRNFTYDGLGRLLNAQDLHASTSSSFGTWMYQYDDAGNLASSTDPKSQNIQYTYDTLNRPLAEALAESGTQVSYTYDSCTNGIGYLCYASSSADQITNSYDILGRIAFATSTISGTSYGTAYTYNLQGKPVTITNPDGTIVSYAYNAAGLVGGVNVQQKGGSTASVADAFQYAPTQDADYFSYANGINTTLTYDPEDLYRLTNITGATSATTTSSSLTSGLVAYWPFNEASGTASDVTGNGFTLTNNNSVTFTSGKIGNAATFSKASDQYFSITSASSSALGLTKFSVGAWIKANADFGTNDKRPIVCKFTANTSGYCVGLGTEGGTSPEYYRALGQSGLDSQGGYSSPAFPNDGAWHYVVYTYDGASGNNATEQWYLDGTLVATASPEWTVASDTSASFIIGGPWEDGSPSNAYWDGQIDELGLWNRVLSAEEVSDLYNGGAGLAYPLNITTLSGTIQNLTYTYDPDGNITNVLDASSVGTGRDVTYDYDPLSRITSASTTAAVSSPYSETFAYNPLGDLTNKSDIGSYLYGETGNANPDAPTYVGTTTYSYDANGNLISASPWTYAWDYKNRLISASSGSATTTFAYDYQGNRLSEITPTVTTTFPNKYYSVASTVIGSTTYATSTDYIYAGNNLIAEIFQKLINAAATGSPTTYYVNTDNLGSINALTDASATPWQVMDYYPYGSTRIASSTRGVNSPRQYIGQYSDASGLSYLNARYYQPAQGQFLTEDPIFLGDPKQQKLQDPQSLNSYSYSDDNPISKSDPLGKTVELISRPIGDYYFLPLSDFGAHTFLYVIPDDPSTIGNINGVNTSEPFTLSALPAGGFGSPLQTKANDSADYFYAACGRLCPGTAALTVAPPGGESSSQFDASVVASYNGLSGDLGPYNPLATPGIGMPNSNYGTTQILTGAGIGQNQMSQYRGQLQNATNRWTPGLGPSYAQQLISQLSSLVSQLSSIVSGLSASSKQSSSK